jgi:hypothetical protein
VFTIPFNHALPLLLVTEEANEFAHHTSYNYTSLKNRAQLSDAIILLSLILILYLYCDLICTGNHV